MTTVPKLDSQISYTGNAGTVQWEGRSVTSVDGFQDYLRQVVGPHVLDSNSSFASDMRALASTGVDTKFVENFFSVVPPSEDWELGEALAECVLRDDSNRNIVWPWTAIRDRKTPRASLPGADLVGFYCHQDKIVLLFGEVKTSSDLRTPPSVMNGKSGMAWQLHRIAKRNEIHFSLLKWLHARCESEYHSKLFREAVKHYLVSEGRDFLLLGVLIRDTTPSDLDLRSRGRKLASCVSEPTLVHLFAWYLPVPIGDWPDLIQEAVR